MTLEEHIYARAVQALAEIPEADRSQIYVISLLVYDEEDDPRRPTITIGYNTEARASECTPARGQEPGWPIASDADEARWNYAFWLQNELAVICDTESDPDGARLREEWAKEQGFWYSDEEEEDAFESAMERVDPLITAFVRIAVEVVRSLHATGSIERALGRPVPVLIHELEYYEEIVLQNREANPAALTRGFERWVLGSTIEEREAQRREREARPPAERAALALRALYEAHTGLENGVGIELFGEAFQSFDAVEELVAVGEPALEPTLATIQRNALSEQFNPEDSPEWRRIGAFTVESHMTIDGLDVLRGIGTAADEQIDRLWRVLVALVEQDKQLPLAGVNGHVLARALHVLRPDRYPPARFSSSTNHLLNARAFGIGERS